MSTTSEMPPPPHVPSPPPAPPRLLRRSDTNRVAGGVAGGLGEYFGVDPVIFRVLFATAAFFGGAGILAYVIAWLAIPDRTSAHAPIDRLLVGGRRSLPVWIVTIIAAAVVFGLMLSWWTPWRFFPWMFFPLVIAALILVIALSQRPSQYPAPPVPQAPFQPDADAQARAAWVEQARSAARERRARSAPVRWATLGGLVVTLAALGIADAARGIVIPAYFWATIAVVLAGVIAGAVLRRPVWLLSLLLIPAVVGTFVFAGCRASLHDGSGANTYTPRSAAQLDPDYRHAFGQTTLDLTGLSTLDAARTVHVTQGAGVVRLIVPASLPVEVHADVHLGQITVDGRDVSDGMGLSSDPLTTASGPALTVDVRVTAGVLHIDHRG